MQTVNQEQVYDDDEIDLRDLVRTLIKRRKTVLLVATVVFLIAVAYALLASPVYKAQVSFLPPTEADVSELNINNNAINAKTVYAIFEKNLNSLKIRRHIFDRLGLIDVYSKKASEGTSVATDAFEQFVDHLSVVKPKVKRGETVIPSIYLTFSGDDPKLLAKTLNELEAATRAATKQEVIAAVTEKINLRKENLNRVIPQLRDTAEKKKNDSITRLLEADKVKSQKLIDQINTLRSSAETKRKDRIQVLTEAAKIAENMGLVDKSSLLDTNITSTSDKNAFYTEVNTQAQPLYLRGSKALRSEIKELSSRTSDDPFIHGLRGLQDKLELLKNNPQINALKTRKDNDPFIKSLREKESELALLEAIDIHPDQIKVATIDQPAFPPSKREKPKRFLVVVLGAILGLFLGIMAAFLLNFRESMREEDLQLAKQN